MANHKMNGKRRREWRDLLYERQDGRCAICGGRMPPIGEACARARQPTLDHKVPRSLGGSNALRNLQLVHRGCNEQKGDRVAAYSTHAGGAPAATAMSLALKRAGAVT